MKRILSLVALAGGITLYAANFLTADIDRDGKEERLEWRPFSSEDVGTFHRLYLYDDDGTLLWKGPATRNEKNPWFVAELDYGISLPELFGDIDGDGKAELLIPSPQSDVSPTWYHRSRWTGTSFEAIPTAAMEYRETPERADLKWTQRFHESESCWVLGFDRERHGLLTARIAGYCVRPDLLYFGKAIVRFAPGGGEVVGWIESFAPAGTAETPLPRQEADSYVARLSRRDHVNSRGIPLRNVRAVLRQDRANFYRFGGDREDRSDPFFRSLKARERMERMRIRPVGISFGGMERAILYGTPLVEIRASGDTLLIHILEY